MIPYAMTEDNGWKPPEDEEEEELDETVCSLLHPPQDIKLSS